MCFRLTSLSFLSGLCLVALLSARVRADGESTVEFIIEPGGFSSTIQGLDFSPPDPNQGFARLLAVAAEGSIRIYDLSSNEQIAQLRQNMSRAGEGRCRAVRFSPDGKWLVASVYSQDEKALRLYRVDQWDEIAAIVPQSGRDIWHLDFTPDGRYLVSANVDGELICWDWSRPTDLRRVKTTRFSRVPGAGLLGINALDNTQLLLVAQGAVQTYSLPELQPVAPGQAAKLYLQELYQPKRAWLNFRLHLQSRLWTSTMQPQPDKYQISLWQLQDGNYRPGPTYDQHRTNPLKHAVDPASKLVASGDWTGEIHLWDGQTGRQMHVFKPVTTPITQVAFAPMPGDPSRIVFNRRIGLQVQTRAFSILQKTLTPIQYQFPASRPAEEVRVVPGPLVRAQAGSSLRQTLSAETAGVTSGSYRLTPGHKESVSILAPPGSLGCRQAVISGTGDGLLVAWDSQTTDPVQPKRFFSGLGGAINSLTVSPNQQYLLGCSENGGICLWSLTDYDPEFTGDLPFRLLTGIVEKVQGQTPVQVDDHVKTVDGKPLARFLEDRLYHRVKYRPGQQVPVTVERGGRPMNLTITLTAGADYVEPLLELLATRDDQWVLWTPRGYYDSQAGADTMIGFLANKGPEKPAEYFPAQRFRETMRQPELLDQIWKTRDVEKAIQEYNARKGLNLPLQGAEFVAANTPPRIEVTSPAEMVALRGETFDLEGIIEGNTEGIEIWVSTIGPAVQAAFDPKTKTFRAQGLQLRDGETVARVTAELKNNIRANPVERRVKGLTRARQRNLYALVVGIGTFSRWGEKDRAYPNASAQQFEAFLQRHQGQRVYGRITVRSLLDQQATRKNIEDQFNQLIELARTDQKSDFMLYFCSHGEVDPKTNQYCLLTHETEPANLYETSLNEGEMKRLLEKLGGQQITLFLDTCHAGKIDGLYGELQNQDTHHGILTYLACGEEQKAETDKETGCTFFTSALMQTCRLNEYDEDKSESVNSYELDRGVVAILRKRASQIPMSNWKMFPNREIFDLLSGP